MGAMGSGSLNADDVSGRHRRDSGGRHRLSVGALRLVGDDAHGWSLAPVSRPTHYIGRVGALAVALGIGGAIVALPAVAVAEPDAGSAAGTAESGDPAPAKPGHRTGARTGPADPGPTDSPGNSRPFSR